MHYKISLTRSLLTSILFCLLALIPTVTQASPSQGINIQRSVRTLINQAEGFRLEIPKSWTELNLSDQAIALGSEIVGENNPQLLLEPSILRQFMVDGVKFYAMDLTDDGLDYLLPPGVNVIKLDVGMDLPMNALKRFNDRQLATLADSTYPLQSDIIQHKGREALLFQYVTAYNMGDGLTQATQLTQLLLTEAGTQYILTIGIPVEIADSYQPLIAQILNSFDLLTDKNSSVHTPSPTSVVTAVSPTATPTLALGQTVATVQVVTLNVRSGPGTIYPRVETANRGTQLAVIGQVKNCSWLQIVLADKRVAWVAGPSQYTQLNRSCTEIPVITALPTSPPPPSPTAIPSQPCVRFDNHFGKDAHVTLHIPDNHEWNQEFTIPPHGKETRCFSPGRYTASVNVPPIGRVNGEFTLDRGTVVIPIQ